MDLRSKRFVIPACGQTFVYTLDIPEYILARFNSEVLDKLQTHMQEYAATVVTAAIRGGYLFTESGQTRMKKDVGLHLKNYVWERFSISQESAGNACWQVAPSLQKVRTTL